MSGEGTGLVPVLGSHRETPSSVHTAVLDSMTNGVMSLDANGVIRTFNQAAASVLSLDRDKVVGSTFADTFVPREGFDAFNEVVLASIYGKGVVRERRVTVTTTSRTVLLALATSYLGSSERGVVAVFVDVTETEELRVKERELAAEVERQHEELRGAYRQLESRNRELGGALRKVQITRIATTVVLLALVTGLVLHGFGFSVDLFGSDAVAESAPIGREHVVRLGRIESVVSVPGEVSPLVEVPVRSPFEATVVAVRAEPGEWVEAGEPLLEFDIDSVKVNRQKAQVTYLKAFARREELASWDSSSDVARARQTVTKARIALDAGRSRLEETVFLYERGLVPLTKKVSAEREQRSREFDLESAERDFATVLAKGVEGYDVAAIEAHNARVERDRLDKLIQATILTAPVGGVVLSRGEDRPELALGDVVKRGQHLLSISEGRSIAVRGRIDEIRIREIQVGDPVRISGAAFPGMRLDGRIVRVSAHAKKGGGNTLPKFPVVVAVDHLDQEQGEVVRLGMSARMDVVVYERDDAVLVPVAAVNPGSRSVVLVDRGTGERRTVRVKTGRTTARAVEILEGVNPGDVVLVP